MEMAGFPTMIGMETPFKPHFFPSCFVTRMNIIENRGKIRAWISLLHLLFP